MSPRTLKILRWAGYPVFYLFALLIFAYLTFPYERLKDRIVTEVNSGQPSDGMRVQIEDLDSYWLSGIEAEGVQLVSKAPAPTPAPGVKASKPKTVTVQEVHARVSLLRLLIGIVHVSFGADAFGGEISGYTSDADDARTIEAELEGVNVGELPMLTQMVGLPLGGALHGTVDLKLPEGKFGKAEGKIALRISDLTVGDGKAKIRDTIALPTLNAGELVLEGEASDGRLKIDKFSANGRDLELVSDGRIRLRDPFDTSLVEMNLRFKFSAAYTNKNDMTRGLFGSPGSNVPGIFDLDPKMRRAKRADGFYSWRLTGPIARLNFEPAALAGSVNAGRTPAARGFAADSE